MARPNPGITYALSDTGPLISAFQADSFALLKAVFTEIWTTPLCWVELQQHGWEAELRAVSPHLQIAELTPTEKARTIGVAKQIADHPATKDRDPESHLGEAQVIALAMRAEHRDHVLLVDELAAREVAAQAGLTLSGFPGVLLLAVRSGLIPPEEVRIRLELCRQKGTHYGRAFIQKVYDMARREQR
jgi:predicted nucleic acid-binding protein